MIWLRLFLGTGNGLLAATVAGLAVLGVWRAFDVSKQRAIGESRAVAKIEKANTDAAQKGSAAARKSLAPGVRGQRDPTTRD